MKRPNDAEEVHSTTHPYCAIPDRQQEIRVPTLGREGGDHLGKRARDLHQWVGKDRGQNVCAVYHFREQEDQ